MIDLPSPYQSEATAWRYEVHIRAAEMEIKSLTLRLQEMQARLNYLIAHPPMYHLFNWSA